MSGFANGGGGYITSAFRDETVACWVRSFLASRNNSISLLPPCVITRWFVTFCGKDASCYCLKTCILNPTEHKSHKHTHVEEEEGTAEETAVSPSPLCHSHFCWSLLFKHVVPHIFPVVALIDCPVDSGPNCQPEWKQTAAGQERLQEAICFYKVDMGRAGLFCWKWLSSSLSPWPWALGPELSQSQRRRVGEERRLCCDMDALAARTRGHSQVAVATLPSPGWRHQATKSGRLWTPFHGGVHLHHGK